MRVIVLAAVRDPDVLLRRELIDLQASSHHLCRAIQGLFEAHGDPPFEMLVEQQHRELAIRPPHGVRGQEWMLLVVDHIARGAV
jgi:hypothetical protein